MAINRIIGRALIAGIAFSAVGLGSAAAAQALPNNTGGSQDCVYNGEFYPHGSAHPTMTDTFCDNGVWKTTLTTGPAPAPARKGSVFVPRTAVIGSLMR